MWIDIQWWFLVSVCKVTEAFAPDGWWDIQADYISRHLNVEESNRHQFLLIKQQGNIIEASFKEEYLT